MENKRFCRTIKLLSSLFCLLILAVKTPLYAQNFKQSLRWNSDPNVLEYKVEIQTSGGKEVTTVTTEESYINLSLKEGSYRYKITAYDFLGREAVSTNWVNFEIAIAKQPEIKHEKKLESLAEDGKTLELAVNVEDVTSDTKAELVNVKTNARIPGKLVLASAAGAPAAGLSSSETHMANKVRFVDVSEGNWKLVITNPSGLSSESDAFEVKDTIKEERIAAAKAEEERKEHERLEAERIAKEEERKAKEEAERLARDEAEKEAQRLAIEKAEREEQERLAREEAEREEIARQIAEEERLEKEREEAERLAMEEAEREEEERLAREEEERLEKEEKKRQRREHWLNYDRKFYMMAGAGTTMALYDNNFFEDLLEKKILNLTFTGQVGWMPVHTEKFRFGMEINGIGAQFKNENEFFNLDLNMLLLQDNLAARIRLNKKLWLQAKGGGGIALVQEILDYSGNTENNKQDKTLLFGYFTAGGGLSVLFIPSAMFMMELGADFYNLFIPDSNMGLLTPYLAIGIRF